MKIVTKLLTAFVFIALIAGVVGVVGIWNIRTISEKDIALYENMTVPITYTTEITEKFQRLRVSLRDMVLKTEIDDINDMYATAVNLNDQLGSVVSEFEKTITTDEVREVYNELETNRNIYVSFFPEYLALCKANKDQEAQDMYVGDWSTSANALQASIDALVELKITEAKVTAGENTATADKANSSMVIIVAVGVLLSLAIGIFISKTICNPVKKLAIVADKIAQGDLDVEIEISSKDEIGQLSRSFKMMTDNLNDVLSNIRTAAEQVAVGSKQVSDSSMLLSQGATEQASSIEELTASIEQIASQTKINAENSANANTYAEAAQKYAAVGNDQMSLMLKSMEDINTSSNSISKIIKVIDDIAFQTNILALNAAVEAARAGQHGKGFAVVAEEVRNLAARSANAAKETTELIEGSINKVNGGTKIAGDTAAELKKIVEGVTKVAELVNNISIASNEQSSGIAQINQGIIQISHVVQANSATSQETAAASEELSGQAGIMEEQVQRFKVKGQTNNTVHAHMNEKTNRIPKEVVSYKPQKSINSISLSDTDLGKY